MRKLKDIWKGLSLTSRKSIKGGIMMTGALVGMGIALGALISVLPIGVALLVGASYLATTSGIAIPSLRKIPDLLNEIKHGKEETTWKNTAGQTIKSTIAEKNDLIAAEKVYPQAELVADGNVVANMIPRKLAKHFNALADKVTVVEDTKNGNGKFRFKLPILAYS